MFLSVFTNFQGVLGRLGPHGQPPRDEVGRSARRLWLQRLLGTKVHARPALANTGDVSVENFEVGEAVSNLSSANFGKVNVDRWNLTVKVVDSNISGKRPEVEGCDR